MISVRKPHMAEPMAMYMSRVVTSPWISLETSSIGRSHPKTHRPNQAHGSRIESWPGRANSGFFAQGRDCR